jgi:hypothetical protein
MTYPTMDALLAKLLFWLCNTRGLSEDEALRIVNDKDHPEHFMAIEEYCQKVPVDERRAGLWAHPDHPTVQ